MAMLPPPAPELVNRSIDPAGESMIGGAITSSSTAQFPILPDSDHYHTGTRSFRSDRTTTSPTDNIAAVNMNGTTNANSTRVICTPGEILSAGGHIRCLIAGARGRAILNFRDAANTTIASNNGPYRNFALGGAFEWFAVENVEAPPLATMAFIQLNARLAIGQLTVSGEQAWFDSTAIYTGPTAYDYFDGNSPSARWLGTPNRSQSARLSLPWQRWNGSALESLNQAGVWDGAAVVPTTFTEVEVAV